ncbi:GTPase-activating protein skywalker-like [Babylonia areolata]|uniref:GTPase-activating protein skywalker-like n=1 Tax=Babylonia areolata TaxID=304850 RepID=UPI003FD04B39
METTRDPAQETMVDLVLQLSSGEASLEGDAAKTEPHRTGQEQDRCASDASNALHEEPQDRQPPESERRRPSRASCSKEEEHVVDTWTSRTGDGDGGLGTECGSQTVVLLDGSCLQDESDVDGVVCVGGDTGGVGGEMVNKLHHQVADLSSMSPSISTDKTVTSSSPSSLDGDSLRSVDHMDSSLSPSRMFTRGRLAPAVGSSSRTAPAASGGSSGAENSDGTQAQEGRRRRSLKHVDASNVDSPSSSPQQTNSPLSPPPVQTQSADVVISEEADNLNALTSSDAHPRENGDSANNHTPTTEPFSNFVDMQRLWAALGRTGTGTGSSPSGNMQEQQLQRLLNSVGEPSSRKQLKKLLRSGLWAVQSTVRRAAWLEVCSHLHKLEKAFVFVQMEKELFGDVQDEDIPVPVWPQQPPQEETMLTEYFLTPLGKNAAHKIVAVIGQLSPDISYCPGLLSLVDVFLHYLDAEQCFSCVLTLLQSKGPVYLMQSRVAFEASKRVVKDLAKKYAKSSYVSLVRSCSNVEAVFDNWLGWIYSDLPFNYMVVVMDSYLMEGIKVLYRVVLALLILYTKHGGGHRSQAPSPSSSPSSSSPTSVAQSISQFCQSPPVPPAKLLKVAFKIRGFSRRKLQKLQNRHEGLIASGAVSPRPDMPRNASKASVDKGSMALSMAHPNTKMMGFHDVGSNILTVDQLVTIWNWLPPRYAICPPTMLFNSADLGTSLMTLYAHIEMEPCTVMVIKTVDGEVFGAFCADPWVERRTYSRPVRFFGTGETFLFTLVPERVKYEWVGKPDPHVPLSANMFQAGDNSSLLIGGGNGCGIQLDGMMERCRTETCDSFNNPPLCPAQDFVPAAIEVFGLSSM